MFRPGVHYTLPVCLVEQVSQNPINNGILKSGHAMPFKEGNSDGDSSFSHGRQLYAEISRVDKSQTHDMVMKKKWIGGNRDASQNTANARINAIGEGSVNGVGAAIAFKNTADDNTARNARQRARSGGSVPPPKKGKITKPF